MDGLRVLHLLGELRPSGMERMLVSGAPGFAALAVHGHVLGVGTDHPFAEEIRRAGYSVTTTDHPAHTSPGRRVLRRVVSAFRPDVIHIHTERRYLQTVFSVRKVDRRVPVVRTVHNVFDAHGRWFASRLLQALIGDRALSALIVPSPDVARNEKRFGRDPQVIFNWVEDRFFELAGSRSGAGPDTTGPVVLVGNCSRIKSHGVALEAALLGNLRVAHIGSEEHAEPAERAILDRLQRNGLLVARGVADPADALLAGRVFAMPSRHEGMPVALAEALVVGMPAVVADVPGLRWATGEPGVVALASREPAVWLDALRGVAVSVSAPTIDFRARRGTAEYAAVYRAAVERR
ncbi:glycosyltransferase involved in cell wall biosynthesis [Curtobacterium sp. PhB142]|nr:glycosyltransferase involved in cell wall biosynthesis [Curtobacterium sp. PhB142]TCL99618.1 glycosyltransferase involved in cell wall biosynthesis [Curtobacterium sp. PhB134]